MAYNKVIDKNITPLGIKDIPGFEGLYAVTADGRVWSYPKRRSSKNGRFLKPGVRNGYHFVVLSGGMQKKSYSVHRIVAITFLPNPENKQEVNHKDGVKTNNHLSNLEWATSKENTRHAINTGLRVMTDDLRKKISESCKMAHSKSLEVNRKLSLDEASEICEAYSTGLFSQQEIALHHGVNQMTISRLIRGVTYATVN